MVIKFQDRFSRFDTIPSVTDRHPPNEPRRHIAYTALTTSRG